MPKPAHLYTYNGYTDTLTGWACKIGISRVTLKSRLVSGWDFEQAITTPIQPLRTTDEIAEALEKRCSICRLTKPLKDFHRCKSRADGYHGECIPCRKEQAAISYKENRNNIRERHHKKYRGGRETIDAAKNRPCMDCNKSYPLPVMHFHHRDPLTKYKEVGKLANYSKEKIMIEIAKCDVLCSNCHIIRHINE